MKKVAGLWQAEDGVVFKLKETGAFKRVEGKLEAELTNDVYMRVSIQSVHVNAGESQNLTSAGIAMKEMFLAEKIATLLNADATKE